MKAICCFMGCGKPAEFGVYGAPSHPDDATEACEDHVGALLGTPVGLPERTHWTVYPLASEPDFWLD